jgi:hypothetical protein
MVTMILRVLLIASLVAGSARADTALDQAKSHVRTATALYDDNDFRGALVEFQRAYELVPSFRILFNIAQVDMQLQDWGGAFTAYTRYLKEGGPDITSARLAQVNAEVERLRARIGFLVVQTTAGAQVLVDDAAVGYAPLPEPVAVSPGSHRITVDVPGRGAITRAFEVAVRQSVVAALAVDPPRLAPVDLTAPAAAVATLPAGPRSRTPVYLAWSITGGLAIGAGVFAVLARGDANDLAAMRAKYGVTADQLTAQRGRTVRDAAIADVATGAAIASAGVALYMTVTRRGDDHPPRERAVQLQIAPGGVAIAGRF